MSATDDELLDAWAGGYMSGVHTALVNIAAMEVGAAARLAQAMTAQVMTDPAARQTVLDSCKTTEAGLFAALKTGGF